MLILGLKNTNDQILVVNDFINFGTIYRKYCKKNSLGVKTFAYNNTNVALQQEGIYHITATITFTAPVAGDVVFQLTNNGVAIDGATATETVTTATTEINTTTIDYFVLADATCVLGQPSVNANVGIQLTGVDATVTNVVLNIEKVV